MEMIFNVCTYIMNSHLRSSITLHGALHGFRQGLGTGTATLEAKLMQQRVGICHSSLLQIFLDVRNAYDLLDQEQCMEIIKGYDFVPKTRRLVKQF